MDSAHTFSRGPCLSLAQYATVYTRSWAVDSMNGRVRLKAENDQLRQEISLLREELRVKDIRTVRIPAHCGKVSDKVSELTRRRI